MKLKVIIMVLSICLGLLCSDAHAGPKNVYGVRKYSPSRASGTRKSAMRNTLNSKSLYGVGKSRNSTAIYGGLRRNYFGKQGSGSSGRGNEYPVEESTEKTTCYGEGRSLCNGNN